MTCYGLCAHILARSNILKLKRLDGFITDSFSLQKSLTDGLLTCVDYLWIIVMFLSAVWTFILTAPIHCRGSIDDQVMLNLSKSVMIKKQIHLHLEWLKGEYILRVQIFIFGWTILLSSLLIAELKYLRLEIRTNPRPECLRNFKTVLALISYLKYQQSSESSTMPWPLPDLFDSNFASFLSFHLTFIE